MSCLRWRDHHFQYDQYGAIVWDTHIYTPGSDSLDEVISFYEGDLWKIRDFQARQGAPVIVGELALSNLK